MPNENIIFYGDSQEVILFGNLDYNDYISIARTKKQSLPGFDDRYHDFIHFIINITHEIWEERGIGMIYDTYHNCVTMHLGSSDLVGIQAVVSNTLQTLHSFPNRRLMAENVIWSTIPNGGFYSSHRILSTATNLGESLWSPATGKKVTFRTVVDCAVQDNRVYEEWLVRDNLAIVTQLGLDPWKVATKMAEDSLNPNSSTLQSTFGLPESQLGQYEPVNYKAKDESIGEWMIETLQQIYGRKMLNEVSQRYHKNATLHFIDNKTLVGHQTIQGLLISFFASFANAAFVIERVTVNQVGEEESESWDIAVRWRLQGLHDGFGYFGTPTLAPVVLSSISHFRVVNRQIAEEWFTFDGLDIMRQISMHQLKNQIKTSSSSQVSTSLCCDSTNRSDNIVEENTTEENGIKE